MAIDNIIAAGIQPATPIMSPMQTMGGLMQLRGQMADQALREAQMAEVRQRQQNEKLRGDQINLELKDTNSFAEIQKDAGLMRKFAETGDVSMFHQAGIRPEFIEKLVAQGVVWIRHYKAAEFFLFRQLAVQGPGPGQDFRIPRFGEFFRIPVEREGEAVEEVGGKPEMFR